MINEESAIKKKKKEKTAPRPGDKADRPNKEPGFGGTKQVGEGFSHATSLH